MKKFLKLALLLFGLALTYHFIIDNNRTSIKNAMNANVPVESAVGQKQNLERNMYRIKIDFDGKNKIVGNMELTYLNNNSTSIDYLYFNLYPNYFTNRDTIPFFKEHMKFIYPEGFNVGQILIKDITQDGNKSFWSYENDSKVLKVKLNKSLSPGEIASLQINFEETIPKAKYRFGYQESQGTITVSLGNWYPILGVYKDNKWHLNTYYGIGDSFYSDISDYSVEISVPKGFIVAASGILDSQTSTDQKTTFKYIGEKIRDFALSISNNYETGEDMIDGIKIVSYFHPTHKQGGMEALDIAKHALEIYNSFYGKYPYPELRLAESNFYFGGMEYPTFIMIDSRKYVGSLLYNTSFERTVAHEVAHQWWYGVVGNDELMEPWLDEGVAQFSSLLYFEKRYGQAGAEAYYTNQINPYLNTINNSKKNLTNSLLDFKNNTEYYSVIYIKGTLFYEDLRKKIGEHNMMDFLKTYYDRFQFKNASIKDFIQLLKSNNYNDLQGSFFKKWFGVE